MKKKKLVIFGLTVSSSWGNGHATVWRALLRSLAAMGHEAIFFERDVPYYAKTRDLHRGDGYELVLYNDWPEIETRAKKALVIRRRRHAARLSGSDRPAQS